MAKWKEIFPGFGFCVLSEAGVNNLHNVHIVFIGSITSPCFPCVHTDMNMNLQFQFQAICPQTVSCVWKMEPRFSDQQKIHQVVYLIVLYSVQWICNWTLSVEGIWMLLSLVKRVRSMNKRNFIFFRDFGGDHGRK